jgi:hypothetical protein
VSRIRSVAIAIATFGAALGIGFAMQNQHVMASVFGRDAPPPAPATVAPALLVDTAILPDGPAMPQPADELLLAAILPANAGRPNLPPAPVLLAALDPEDLPVLVGAGQAAPAADPACTPVMSVLSGPLATAIIDLQAPCNPDAIGTLHHQGMMFSFLTDAAGAALLSVPALAVNAVFMAELPGGVSALAVADLPEAAGLDRAVLQWEGPGAFQLHVSEFGAEFGTSGHLWAGATGDITVALGGDAGYLTVLGDLAIADGMRAQVYTFPTALSRAEGVIALSVEAPITAANCGRDLAAQGLQFIPGQDPMSLDLTLRMPGCDAVGDYLLLKNMFADLTLAAR